MRYMLCFIVVLGPIAALTAQAIREALREAAQPATAPPVSARAWNDAHTLATKHEGSARETLAALDALLASRRNTGLLVRDEALKKLLDDNLPLRQMSDLTEQLRAAQAMPYTEQRVELERVLGSLGQSEWETALVPHLRQQVQNLEHRAEVQRRAMEIQTFFNIANYDSCRNRQQDFERWYAREIPSTLQQELQTERQRLQILGQRATFHGELANLPKKAPVIAKNQEYQAFLRRYPRAPTREDETAWREVREEAATTAALADWTRLLDSPPPTLPERVQRIADLTTRHTVAPPPAARAELTKWLELAIPTKSIVFPDQQDAIILKSDKIILGIYEQDGEDGYKYTPPGASTSYYRWEKTDFKRLPAPALFFVKTRDFQRARPRWLENLDQRDTWEQYKHFCLEADKELTDYRRRGLFVLRQDQRQEWRSESFPGPNLSFTTELQNAEMILAHWQAIEKVWQAR